MEKGMLKIMALVLLGTVALSSCSVGNRGYYSRYDRYNRYDRYHHWHHDRYNNDGYYRNY
ncbi:hypothetical protein [Mucilaginibacter sp. MD40]|uniref:hypothetical protein n=1 Tax=Mucilaginibacter sp. MD40 TaxID=2029590 RepID=UPI0011808450|nr:hypothetical protein [Mucilaginibacter sp. MD40]